MSKFDITEFFQNLIKLKFCFIKNFVNKIYNFLYDYDRYSNKATT